MDLGVRVHFVHIYGAWSGNALFLYVLLFDPLLRCFFVLLLEEASNSESQSKLRSAASLRHWFLSY